MFCENCGKEIPDNATFCSHCGFQIKNKVVKKASNEKNMILALIISFFLTGLGIVYAGEKKKGIILFVVALILYIIGRAVPILAVIAILIWAYALYETYNQVKIANGNSNPNLIEDIKTFPTGKKIAAIVVIAIILLIVVGGVMGAFSPKTTTSKIDDDLDTVDSDSISSSSSDSSSSGSSGSNSAASSGESYSSSSNGNDVHSHYEGDYGSSDLDGRINDDGSVDAHETGHTDYGDYEINSHMDSDGKVSGTVEVGGQTYHVST